MKTLKERLEKNLYYSIDGCHYWTGCVQQTNPDRGKMNIKGRSTTVYRIAYEIYIGQIPDGLCVLHSCDNGLCCNPDHLFLGTQLENIQDMMRKGRQAKGIRNGQTKLNESIVLAIRSSNLSQSILGKLYNISPSTIGDLRNRRSWKHI